MKFKKLHPDAKQPSKAHARDSGYDLYALEDTVVFPGQTVKIKTGISIEFDDWTFGLICDRSSIAANSIKVMGCVIDWGYTGEILVCLCNIHGCPLIINAGDRIAQMLVLPLLNLTLEEVKELENSERGEKGFGSSGR